MYGGGWMEYLHCMPPILTAFEYHGITEQIITIESCPDTMSDQHRTSVGRT